MVKKIVILGPESTGKSSLCELLAQHYKTTWCPEYAREYLFINGTDYTYDDLLHIARGQIALEDKYAAKMTAPPLTTPYSPLATPYSPFFIDTDMYVMKVWCEFVFGKCHRYILDQIVERKYDLYLLCDTDLPWIEDDLREYPDLVSRRKLYMMYKDIMVNQPVPWVHIYGSYENRLEIAVAAIDKLLEQ